MNVFENVYAYVTVDGYDGIVRADSIDDAKSRVLDFYHNDEIKAITPLDMLDNDHGVVTKTAISEALKKKCVVKQYAVDIMDDVDPEEIAKTIENTLGVIVLGSAWKATWTLEDYEQGKKPISSD